MMDMSSTLSQLDRVLELATPVCPSEAGRAEEVATIIRGRFAVGSEHTVVAFAGATGAGKSSLINALVGSPVARVAATRPATTEALAVSASPAGELLDWLGVRSRVEVPELLGVTGTVLIDLPDFDSFEDSHREIADAIIARADLVVFVLDPQKYADAVVHNAYLAALREHGATTLVVLNQIDRIGLGERPAVIADARSVLAADGVDTDLLVASAASREGLGDLARAIAQRSGKRNAARLRAAADVRSVASQMTQADIAAGGADGGKRANRKPVREALSKAAGSDVLADAAGRAYEVRARKRAAGILGRWIRRRDPVQDMGMLRCGGVVSLAAEPGRMSGARNAVRRYVDSDLAHLSEPWRALVSAEVDGGVVRTVEGATGMTAKVDLGIDRRRWWTLARHLFTLSFLVALCGVAWLGGYAARETIGVALARPPYVGPFSVPSLMVLSGVAVTLLLHVLVRRWRRLGARRVRSSVVRQFSALLEESVDRSIFAVVDRARSDYDEFRALLRSLARAE